jgi:succinoglycan biosynthesis transport protein ExoP
MNDQGKPAEDRLLTLGDLFRFLMRRRWTIIATTAIILALGILYSALATRRYKAEALIEIKQPEDSLGLNRLVSGSTQGQASESPLEENVTLATKVAELESESLALRVVQELQLEGTKDFKSHRSLNPLSYIQVLFASPAKKDRPGTALIDSPTRREAAFRNFESHLKVDVVSGTRLISIDFQNPDPDVAANVVNALTNDLAQYSFETRYKAVQQLSSWLADQLDSVRQQAEDMQQQEAALRRDTETFNMGGTNAAGQTLVYSPLLDHLQQATQSLSSAESNRIVRGAVQQIAQTRDPKLISGLGGSSLSSSGNPQSTTSLDLVKELQGKETQQEMLVTQDEQRYGIANPKLIQEKAQLTAIRKSLKSETERLVDRASNDYKIALQEEDGARTKRDALIKEANNVNDRVLRYEIVHQEAEDARQLYTQLNNRVREAGVLAGLQSNDMTIVSAAFSTDRPSSPRVLLILPAALVLGLFIGVMIAGIQDVRDDKVNSVDTVETELGIPVYAVTPDFNASSSLYSYGKYLYRSAEKNTKSKNPNADQGGAFESPVHVMSDPDSQYSESLRTLRTAILLSRPDQSVKSILITSSTPAEGKSTTSCNLAATFARTGTRTLLVEVDLRKPVLARRLGLPPGTDGLSRILSGQLSRDWVLSVPGISNLDCVPAGQRPPDPHELISSSVMKQLMQEWAEKYDLIILDGPPVLPVIDSVLLSELADLVLVITRFGRTSVNSLRTTHRLLSRQVRANIGAVLNAVAQGSEGYYDYYGYRYSAYKYDGTEEEG